MGSIKGRVCNIVKTSVQMYERRGKLLCFCANFFKVDPSG